MSKKYCYFAKKRSSHRYYEATTTCKGNGNFTSCKTCLKYAGYTRNKQKEDTIKKNNLVGKITFL